MMTGLAGCACPLNIEDRWIEWIVVRMVRGTDSKRQTEGERPVRGNSESESGLGSVFQVAVAWEGPLSTHTQVG